jgi:hypothetical protein
MTMLSQDQKDFLAQSTRIMQVIGGSLIAGILLFLVVAYGTAKPNPDASDTISLAAAAAGFLSVGVSFVVSKLLADQSIAARSRVDDQALSSHRQEGDVGPVAFLAGVYQTSFIVGAAVLEGAAFFNLVTYFTGGQLYSIAVAVMLAVGIALRIPTRRRVETWVADKLREHRELNSFDQSPSRS